MGGKGPSPLVPSLMVGALGLVICWPALLSLLEILVPLFQAGEGIEGRATVVFVMVVLILVLLALHLLSAFFSIPVNGISSYPHFTYDADGDGDGFGFGLGTFLLLLLFFLLYNLV